MSDNIYHIGVRPDGTLPITVEAVKDDVQPQSGTIKALEKLLAMAKTGRLQTFVGVGFTDTGERVSLINVTHPNVHEMLGSLNWLAHEYVEMVQDKRK